jgi:hypothetical protein
MENRPISSAVIWRSLRRQKPPGIRHDMLWVVARTSIIGYPETLRRKFTFIASMHPEPNLAVAPLWSSTPGWCTAENVFSVTIPFSWSAPSAIVLYLELESPFLLHLEFGKVYFLKWVAPMVSQNVLCEMI